jgi:hypothetical protein
MDNLTPISASLLQTVNNEVNTALVAPLSEKGEEIAIFITII